MTNVAATVAHTPPDPAPGHRLFALAAGKGGVGTSTAAVMLAATLAAEGRDVLLVDAANRLGTLDAMLGVEPTVDLDALRGGATTPESLLMTVDDRLTLLPSRGVGGTSTLPPAERRVLFGRVAALFPRYDIVVMDAGSSAESILAACALGASRVLAVTAGDRIGVTATYALLKLLHERHPATRVDLLGSRVTPPIANLVHDCINAATVRFLSKTVHLAGVVPDDPQFGIALTAGLGTRVASQDSPAAPLMHDIGHALLDTDAPGAFRQSNAPRGRS